MMAKGNGQLACAALVVGLVLALATPAAVGAASEPRPFKKHSLKYFVQLQGGSPGVAPNFLPPLNTSFSATFGAGVLFALNITKGESRTSKLLGSVRGFTVDTNFVAGAPSRNLEVAFIEYDDGRFAGTLQLQGLVQASATEVAITGGTGSFRGARGYIIIALVKMTPGFITFSHDLHLF